MDNADTIDELLEACQRGDRLAQKALYELYSPSLYALALRYMGIPERAQDVLIESFTLIFRHLEKHRPDGSLEAWMRRITVRRALRHLRRKWNNTMVLHHSAVPEPPRLATPEQELCTKVALEDGLSRLSPEERTVFNLVAVEGYHFADLPRLTGIAVHNAKRIYAKARETMKQTLTEHEITL